jgi:hypothetical protein
MVDVQSLDSRPSMNSEVLVGALVSRAQRDSQALGTSASRSFSNVREIAFGFRSEGSHLAIPSQIARVGNSADSGFLI